MEEPASVSFILASCQYPVGLLDRRVAQASYERMGLLLDRLPRGQWPCALLLAGDQVYVDATAGLFDPTNGYDAFERPYRRLLSDQFALRQVSRRLPVYAMIDDHEIEDNWEPIDHDLDREASDDARERMVNARKAYVLFERGALPPERPDRMWYAAGKSIGGLPLFMADTRTERTPRTAATIRKARIMSEEQFKALCHWLETQPADQPKLVLSPSILLPRRRRAIQNLPASAIQSDAWDGYPLQLHALLAHIAAKDVRNVVFLSGDEHLSCVAAIRLTDGQGKETLVHSVHSSPLHGPFPFANSLREDLVAEEKFGLDGSSSRCAVETEFGPPGDGFALLRMSRGPSGWNMSCIFDRRDGAKAIERSLA